MAITTTILKRISPSGPSYRLLAGPGFQSWSTVNDHSTIYAWLKFL